MASERERRPRVLVVDDDRLMRELVADAVGPHAEVDCCADAEEALASLSVAPADLVISDLVMPGRSGLDLLERVRRESPGTDFVLLTGDASVESAVRALRMGAADYLTKPIQPEELGLVVDRVLARRRLLAENERMRDELRTLEACRTLLRCLEPGEVYAVALDLVIHTVPCERGIAFFQRSDMPGSDGMAFRGFDEHEAQQLRAALGEKTLEVDALERSRWVSEGELLSAVREAGIECPGALLVPIRGRQDEAGCIWLWTSEEGAREALERVELVASHARLALENAERYHRAKERAFLDDVTDVYNARFLLQATSREIQRADRSGKELTVLFLDLDRFKLVNDRYGHLVGSDVLRQLSRVLLDCIRQVDTLARYGGDEFTILLIDTDIEAGLAIGERIRRTVAETVFEGEQGTPIRLTISIGVAAYPAHARDRDGLLDAADKAMYLAKSRGRNCLASAGELRSP